MTGGDVGNNASFGGLNLSTGTVGHGASIGGPLHMTGGSIGDNLDMQNSSRAIVEGGSIGSGAYFSGLTLSNASIGDNTEVDRDFESDFSTPSLLITSGTIGTGLIAYSDAQINGGQIGTHAEFRATVQVNGGTIGDDATFQGDFGLYDPPNQIMGGSVGDRATFWNRTQIDGGTVGDDAEFWSKVDINGGVIGHDAEFRGNVDITGGVFGNRFTLSSSRRLVINGTEFFLDGVNIGSALNLYEEIAIFDRDVMLTGVLSSGTPFEFLLSDDFGNQGVTDYFRPGSLILIKRTEGPIAGDLNGDGAVTNADISAFVMALTDPAGYEAAYPGLYANNLGDFNDDGLLTNGDIAAFVNTLTGGGPATIPEPGSLGLLLGAGVLAGTRRRKH